MGKNSKQRLFEVMKKLNPEFSGKDFLNESINELTENDAPLDSKGQSILKAMESYADKYLNKFIGEIMNVDSNWKTLTQYKERVANILAKSPREKFANILVNYPQIQKAVNI